MRMGLRLLLASAGSALLVSCPAENESCPSVSLGESAMWRNDARAKVSCVSPVYAESSSLPADGGSGTWVFVVPLDDGPQQLRVTFMGLNPEASPEPWPLTIDGDGGFEFRAMLETCQRGECTDSCDEMTTGSLEIQRFEINREVVDPQTSEVLNPFGVVHGFSADLRAELSGCTVDKWGVADGPVVLDGYIDIDRR